MARLWRATSSVNRPDRLVGHNLHPMIVSLSAIPAIEVEPYTATLFSPRFAAQELGRPGQWYGAECRELGLQGHVDKKVLDNLLLGRSPDGSPPAGGSLRQPTQPAGWVLTFEMDRRHKAIWAIGSEENRQMAEAFHAHSVTPPIDQFDALVRRTAGFRDTDRVGAVYAMFLSGTSLLEGQTPGLRTSVIIPNGHVRNDGSVLTFREDLLSRCESRLHYAYLCDFVPRAFYGFGRIGSGAAEVPKDLFKPLSQDPLLGGPRDGSSPLIFQGQDLFRQWKRQAELRGFGAGELAEVLREARAQSRLHSTPVEPESPGATALLKELTRKLWDYCLRPSAPEYSRGGSSDGHRPSL